MNDEQIGGQASASAMAPFRPDRLKWLVLRCAITTCLTALLYAMAGWQSYSGDAAHMAALAEGGWQLTRHSSLTSILHRVAYLMLEPFDFDGWNAISISNALAGALALQLLVAYKPHLLFLGVNILAGSFLVFVGQVENYAWVNLCLLAWLMGMDSYFKGERRLWPVASLLFLAALFHMLALFYLPALFWAMRRGPRFKAWEFLAPFCAFVGLSIGMSAFLPGEGFELGLTRLVPFFETHRPDQWFTFFSRDHLEIKVYFLFYSGILLMPLGWPIVIVLWRRIRTPYRRFLLLNALLGLGWFIVWHPDLGWIDWDLFSQPCIPLHFLAGVLLADGKR